MLYLGLRWLATRQSGESSPPNTTTTSENYFSLSISDRTLDASHGLRSLINDAAVVVAAAAACAASAATSALIANSCQYLLTIYRNRPS